jgi:hypothetical protein
VANIDGRRVGETVVGVIPLRDLKTLSNLQLRETKVADLTPLTCARGDSINVNSLHDNVSTAPFRHERHVRFGCDHHQTLSRLVRGIEKICVHAEVAAIGATGGNPLFSKLIFCTAALALAQEPQTDGKTARRERAEETVIQNLFAYLNMSGTKSAEFRPLTQRERNSLYGESFINPIWYVKGAISAAQNQWSDLPEPWEQGASGYGKRFGDIMGQYAIRRTVMHGFESWFHEDNRYFPSSKKGFWPRTGYALSSGLMGRHDNGKRYPSASILIGYASGAYLSRFWQPSPERSVGDAAVSFGVSMGWNIGFGVVKEYLPDMLRPLRRKSRAAPASPSNPPTEGVAPSNRP